jgi:DNA-binding SARP family transcriptional activator
MVTETLPLHRSHPQSSPPDRSDPILVCLLGTFRVLRHGEPVDRLVAGKAMTLLSTLALHLESGVPREALLDTLWPEQDITQSTVSLHSLVYTLQQRLRHSSHRETALLYANGSYYLNRGAGCTTDIAHFDELVATAHSLAVAGEETAARGRYEAATALYRGDLCTGTDVYAVIERERLRASFLTVLAWLADHAYRGEDYGATLHYALLLLTYDPCREDAHRLVMRARLRRGERAQALRQYRLCEHVLRREFDTAPEPLTTELFDRIRTDPAGV